MSAVIFLDFDGVIRIPQEAHISRVGSFKHAVFCKQRMDLVENLCGDMDAKIVISSAWRTFKSKDEVFRLLTAKLSARIHGDWATQDFGSRWEEIEYWLECNNHSGAFVILDDQASHFNNSPEVIKANLVLCEYSEGLTGNSIDKAKHILA